MRGRAGGWRTGRGLLGVLDPLIGPWEATAETPEGIVRVERVFRRVLGGRWVRLEARSYIGTGVYEEIAMFGRRPDGILGFWSFTSDGRHAEGWLADASDLPAGAIAFEADMPAGRARQAYWPRTAGEAGDDDDGAGYAYVVEARTAGGWSRSVEQRYRPSMAPGADEVSSAVAKNAASTVRPGDPRRGRQS